MSVLNFLFGNRTASGFQISGIVEFSADLTIDENHERVATVTDHPVESGAMVSDHVILSPERLRLTGFVTDTGAALFANDPGRTQGAFDTLDAAWRAREPITVVTGRKTYQDMIITRLDLPRSRPSSMRFSIEMQHVEIVASQTAAVTGTTGGEEAESADVQDRAASRVDAGRQPTRQSSDSTESAARSAQTSVLGDIFGVGN